MYRTLDLSNLSEEDRFTIDRFAASMGMGDCRLVLQAFARLTLRAYPQNYKYFEDDESFSRIVLDGLRNYINFYVHVTMDKPSTGVFANIPNETMPTAEAYRLLEALSVGEGKALDVCMEMLDKEMTLTQMVTLCVSMAKWGKDSWSFILRHAGPSPTQDPSEATPQLSELQMGISALWLMLYDGKILRRGEAWQNNTSPEALMPVAPMIAADAQGITLRQYTRTLEAVLATPETFNPSATQQATSDKDPRADGDVVTPS